MITLDFQNRLKDLINEFNIEDGSNTPDFILAEYLVNCLRAYETIHKSNEDWYGKKLKI